MITNTRLLLGREMPAIELYPPGSQTITEGGSVLFHCRVLQGIPAPTIHWSRVDGLPFSPHVEQLPAGVLRYISTLMTISEI